MKIPPATVALCTALGVILSTPAEADSAATVSSTSGLLSDVGSSTLDSSVSPDGGMQVSAGQGNSSAMLKGSLSVSSRERPATGVGVFSVLSIVASSPLSKSSATTDLGTLDGLTDSTTLEIRFSQLLSTGLRKPTAEAEQESNKICGRAIEAFKKANSDVKDVPVCDMAFVQKYDRAEFTAYKGLFFEHRRHRTLWGVSGKSGYQNYKYTDTMTLVSENTNKVPWSASAFYAWNPDAGRTLLTATVSYQRAFADAKSKTVCPNDPTSSSTITCASGPFGVPVTKTQEIVSGEVRHAFGRFGFAVAGTYDLKSGTKGLDVPIYLVRSTNGVFTGGIRCGWRSDTGRGYAAIFVGSPLSLFNGVSAGGKQAVGGS